MEGDICDACPPVRRSICEFWISSGIFRARRIFPESKEKPIANFYFYLIAN
jgi:hypothetical protein